MEDFGKRVAMGYGVLLGGVWFVALGLEQNGADHSSNGIWNLVSTLRWILSAPIPIAIVAWLIARPRKEGPASIPYAAANLIDLTPKAHAVMAENPAPAFETVVERTTPQKDQVQSEPVPQEPRRFSNASEAAASALEELL
jgi:hypothetical protein